MAFVSDLFDQLRDLLNDASDTQVPFGTKKLYLNRGISRMYPRVGKLTSDTSLTVVDATYEYMLPTGAADGLVVSVEIETDVGSNQFTRFDRYDIIPGDEDLTAKLILLAPLPEIGRDLRIRYFGPIPQIAAASYAAAGSETWTGPDRAIGLPALYAMGMLTVRKLDDRQDTLRYSTTQATNGVTDTEIMGAAQMWFGQFEAELAEMERPLPPARD
jgi:hypothetical protein